MPDRAPGTVRRPRCDRMARCADHVPIPFPPAGLPGSGC
jgi:hypothetical protein